jgi:Transposase
MVRTGRHQLRPVAGDSVEAEAVKVLTRAHKTLIWERTRHLPRLRQGLREFFPSALVAFDDLTAVDPLELLAVAPDPASAAALSVDTIEAALKKARRHHRTARARRRSPPPCAPSTSASRRSSPPPTRSRSAPRSRSSRSSTPDRRDRGTDRANFSKHPGAAIYLSQPGLGTDRNKDPMTALRSTTERQALNSSPDYADLASPNPYPARDPTTTSA